MAEILVDQSHCNYHLADALAAQGWTILFTDAGRVSRGGAGMQGRSLRVFEEHGLPIPDIVAVFDDQLLLVEIDSAPSKATISLANYQEAEPLIATSFGRLVDTEIRSMLVGFCRTGIARDPEKANQRILEDESLDVAFSFRGAREPVATWSAER